MEDEASVSNSAIDAAEVVIDGSILKLSRNKQWQERYFVVSSDQILSYYHQKGDTRPRASFQITRESGCEISDIFVEQRQKGTGKEPLYCFHVSWPDDNKTASTAATGNTRMGSVPESEKDDGSIHDGSPARERSSLHPLSLLKSPLKPLKMRQRPETPPVPRDDAGLELPASPYPEYAGRRRQTRADNNGGDEGSLTSLGTPTKNARRSRPWFRREHADSYDRGMPNHDGSSTSSGRKGGGRPPMRRNSRNNSVPAVVSMELAPPPLQGDSGSAHEGSSSALGIDNNDADQQQSQSDRSATSAKAPFGKSNSDHKRSGVHSRGSDATLKAQNEYGKKSNKNMYRQQHAKELEKLHHEFFDAKGQGKRSILRESGKKVMEGTRLAAAAGAAVGVGVLTAGVGVAAGLVVLGAAAAASGTAGITEAGFKKWNKSSNLTLAATNYEVAKLWRSSIHACREVKTVRESRWGRMFIDDGRKTTTALMPHDVELMTLRSRDSMGTDASPIHSSHRFMSVDSKGHMDLFFRDTQFCGDAKVKWRPLEGGWASLLGPGAQSLRIFREEKIRIEENAEKVALLAVGSSTRTPLKAQVVLKALPLDAFMCLLAYARMPQSDEDILCPNSGQSASFRLIEKIDEHTDIVHMVCRKLYLFPSWTEPRDFVLFRYWRYEPDGSYVICYESVEHHDCPPQPGYVRGEMHQVCTLAPRKSASKKRNYSASQAHETLLTTVVQVDPKGWVPTSRIPFLSNQTYADAFSVAALMQLLDVRDAIECDRFVAVSLGLQSSNSPEEKGEVDSRPGSATEMVNYDLRFAGLERRESVPLDSLSGLESRPPPLRYEKWAEPDANSFLVRGPTYKTDRKKINAGNSIGQLVAVDLVEVDKPIFTGLCTHPTERIQLALERERKSKEAGKECNMPPFIFAVNILVPGPPFYHAVFYYAVDDMSTIDGSNGSGSSQLCNKFLFGESDEFRDKTFKLIPQIVEGNFMVRKAVGSTPAILGTRLKQYYIRHGRYMELIVDCSSSPVAAGVVRLSSGYAKTLVVDMGFLLEGDEERYLPERIFGCARLKHPEFKGIRKVEDPTSL